MTSREAAPPCTESHGERDRRLVYSYFQYLAFFFEQMLAKNRNHVYNAIVMNEHIRQPSPSVAAASERATERSPSQLPALNGESGAKDFFGPGGRSKSLKRLNPAKEIQGKPRLFLGFSLGWLGPAWLDLGSAWVCRPALGAAPRRGRRRNSVVGGVVAPKPADAQ